MKLQSKQQINNIYQETRRKEIDEGVKLATKIDGLRQTLASLEAQHKAFLTGMSRELEEKTKEKQKDIQFLESEVKKLEERKRLALEPIDKEWLKLDEAKEDYKNLVNSLKEDQQDIVKRRNELSDIEKKLRKDREDILNQQYETDLVSRETNELYLQAKQYRDSQKEEYNIFITEKNNTEKTLKDKEKQIKATEKYQTHREKLLNSKEAYLEKLEIKLKDRSERLKKTLKELNKK